MIILDLNQVMISNIMALYGKHIDDKPIEIDLFRSVVLNNIRDPEIIHQLLRKAVRDARSKHNITFQEEM